MDKSEVDLYRKVDELFNCFRHYNYSQYRGFQEKWNQSNTDLLFSEFHQGKWNLSLVNSQACRVIEYSINIENAIISQSDIRKIQKLELSLLAEAITASVFDTRIFSSSVLNSNVDKKVLTK